MAPGAHFGQPEVDLQDLSYEAVGRNQLPARGRVEPSDGSPTARSYQVTRRIDADGERARSADTSSPLPPRPVRDRPPGEPQHRAVRQPDPDQCARVRGKGQSRALPEA